MCRPGKKRRNGRRKNWTSKAPSAAGAATYGKSSVIVQLFNKKVPTHVYVRLCMYICTLRFYVCVYVRGNHPPSQDLPRGIFSLNLHLQTCACRIYNYMNDVHFTVQFSRYFATDMSMHMLLQRTQTTNQSNKHRAHFDFLLRTLISVDFTEKSVIFNVQCTEQFLHHLSAT